MASSAGGRGARGWGEELEVGQAFSRLGHRGTWSARHVPPARLFPLRRLGDPLADAAHRARRRERRERRGPEGAGCPGAPGPGREDALGELRAAERAGCPAAARLLREARTRPAWLDPAKVRAGQRFFMRHLHQGLSILGHVSLVGGFSAPWITPVLRATGYLTGHPRYVVRRLLETVSMVVSCMEDDGALEVGGRGWEACLRVRLLHSAVRARLLEMDAWAAGPDEWGHPINQEDMVVTLLSFSYNVVYGFQQAGNPVDAEEAEAYIHAWRYIGFLLGVAEEHNPCTSLAQSKATLESCALHLIPPDPPKYSVDLAHHVLKSFASISGRGYGYHSELARLLLGPEIADALEIAPQGRLVKAQVELTRFWWKLITRTSHMGVVNDWYIFASRSILRVLPRTKHALTHAPSDANLRKALAPEGEDGKRAGEGGRGAAASGASSARTAVAVAVAAGAVWCYVRKPRLRQDLAQLIPEGNILQA